MAGIVTIANVSEMPLGLEIVDGDPLKDKGAPNVEKRTIITKERSDIHIGR